MKLTKKQVEQMFRENVLPEIRAMYEQDGRRDAIARREAWNNFTDALCKDRQITLRQYENWTHPAICG